MWVGFDCGLKIKLCVDLGLRDFLRGLISVLVVGMVSWPYLVAKVFVGGCCF